MEIKIKFNSLVLNAALFIKLGAIGITKTIRGSFFLGKMTHVHRSCQPDDRLSRVTVLMSPCRISES